MAARPPSRHPPGSPEELNEIVRKMIADRMAWGQLDECPLTLADLDLVRIVWRDHARHVPSAPALSGAGTKSRTRAAQAGAAAPNQPLTPKDQ